MKKAKLFMMLALLVMGVSNVFAQDVTIRPDNGNTLPALKSGATDTFYGWGGFATWKHEQLSLTMTTGDSDNNLTANYNQLTHSGQLAKPANDIFKSGNYLQIGKGRYLETYITIALPKGYRITSYSITFHRISYPTPDGEVVAYDSEWHSNWPYSGGYGRDWYIHSKESNNYVDETSNSLTFGETDKAFSYTNDKPYESGIEKGDDSQYTITRTSHTDTDMDNVLYFKLSAGEESTRAFIQLDNVKLEFTAEAEYRAVSPGTSITGQTAVDIPFATSKMDYGHLEKRKDSNEIEHVSYDGTIHDMIANLTLYEDGSVTAEQDNGYDGTVGKMVDYKDNGSISSADKYFKLDISKHQHKTSSGEAIYYIESPIWATSGASSTANKNPIGYRIIGANFELARSVNVRRTFKIEYTSTGHGPNENGLYGLNYYSGKYNWTPKYHTVWSIDNDGYINYGDYYLGIDNQNNVIVVDDKANATKFEIDNNGIKRKGVSSGNRYIGWKEEVTGTYIDDNGEVNDNVTRSAVLVGGSGNKSTFNKVSDAKTESVGAFTFNIYDKTGKKIEKTVTVSRDQETLSIDSLNNDAVKISVTGDALIKGELIMQALDPYLDRLDIVCQEIDTDGKINGGRLTQQFNATDFSVRGKEFTFYVPTDFKKSCKFTFENLYSKYGDNTYYNETSSTDHARYFFVESPYAKTNTNVYKRDAENATYDTKVYTLKKGNRTFRFNNADEVAKDTGEGGYFEEYPFTKAKYTQAGGSFEDLIFTQDDMKNNSPAKEAYLFTCDETRYNIAPTNGTQHVYYAYYELKMKMRKANYDPIVTFDKIYDHTFYSANNSDIKRDAQYGAIIHTENVTDDAGTHEGYLTVEKIVKGIEDKIKEGGENVPSSKDQILYINARSLMSIADLQTPNTTQEPVWQLDEDGEPVLDENGDKVQAVDEDGKPVYKDVTNYTSTMSQLKDGFGTNVLVYLPVGVKSSLDNFASWSNDTKMFEAANNIIVTDRYPFYAPFDIQVGSANMAKYERTLTNQALYGDDDQHLTIVLPFEINVDDTGVHSNNDGEGSPFTLATMNGTNSLSKNKNEEIDYYAIGYFNKLTGKSEPNKPYVVTMQGNGTESSFKVHVNGSLVKATPDKSGIYANETASGDYTYKEDNVEKTDHYDFTHKGTYTGIEIGEDGKGGAAAAGTKVFYFANNFFLDSKTLINEKSLKMLPFRSYYQYAGPDNAKMSRFRIVFGENPYANETTGINEVQRDADLAVIPGKGIITLMARADKDVTIHSVSGITVDKCSLNAGETRTVAVPAGVYVINGVKMVVK